MIYGLAELTRTSQARLNAVEGFSVSPTRIVMTMIFD